MHVARLTLSRCALVLELLVVEVAGVGAGHVESVPITPCRTVRLGTLRRTRYLRNTRLYIRRIVSTVPEDVAHGESET